MLREFRISFKFFKSTGDNCRVDLCGVGACLARLFAMPSKGSSADVVEDHTQLRTLVKTFSWRVFATLTTVLIAWAVTEGGILGALRIGALDFGVKFVAYFAHERLWLTRHLQALQRRSSMYKLMSWKAVALSITLCVVLLRTGRVRSALRVGPFDTGVKTLTHWLHESAWRRVEFGRVIGRKAKLEKAD